MKTIKSKYTNEWQFKYDFYLGVFPIIFLYDG